MTTLSSLPPAPSRGMNPAQFVMQADAFLAALPILVSQFNQLANEVNSNAILAQQSATTVSAVVDATVWVSGQTYAQYAAVISPTDYQTYRRKTASGSGTTDPKFDTVNWTLLNPLPASVTLYNYVNLGGL